MGNKHKKGRGRNFGKKKLNIRTKALSGKEKRHIQQFGEQHPSADLNDDFAPSSKKCKKAPDNLEPDPPTASEESSDEESTYRQVLNIFTKTKKDRKKVQIVSEDEDESSLSSEHEEPSAEFNKEDNLSDEDSDEGTKEIEEKSSESNVASKNIDKYNDDNDDVEQEGNESDTQEAEICEDMENELDLSDTQDPFLLHFERGISHQLANFVKKKATIKISCVWPHLDKLTYTGYPPVNDAVDIGNSTLLLDSNRKSITFPKEPSKPDYKLKLEDMNVKSKLLTTFPVLNKEITKESKNCFTPIQAEVFKVINNYYDAYFPNRTLNNAAELRNVCCLHIANHVLKTRTRILHHNAKLIEKIDVPDTYRDQGFVRPKVLILVPFKNTAYRYIVTLINLLLEVQKGNVANKKRFIEEYTEKTLFLPKTNPKPDDYNKIFEGNSDDNFKIGLSLTKKTVKLYTEFYHSDVIIASPLGLRVIIGAPGEKDRDYDFLSSIEVLVMDQSDIFLMQNWDHLLHVMKHLNIQPVSSHGTDFSRIRPWVLDGFSPLFRQTVIFSSEYCPEHAALFTKYCTNYAGQVRLNKTFITGTIDQVQEQLLQVFQRFEVSSLENADDERFKHFVEKVLPNFQEKLMSHTLVFVSNYFDFVRLRNYFKREQTSFVQICEYSKEKKIARARDYFFHGKGHFMLYTERAHFFRRFRLKGIGHIIFFELPQNSHFYAELCNFVREDYQNHRVRIRQNSSINAIYCKYDSSRLAALVGTERAMKMMSSNKSVHAFLSGEL